MLSPLLETKLYAARLPGRSVSRPRLTEQLARGSSGRLLLVSAPAGFGKTTALAQWVHALGSDQPPRRSTSDTDAQPPAAGHGRSRRRPGRHSPGQRTAVAWLSLDASDNDPHTFCRYLVAAFRRATPDLGEDQELQLEQLRTGMTVGDATSLLAGVLNDIADLAHDVALVLDDYHVVDAPEVHEQLTFLVEHAPPQLHIAVATRSDPPLPLARLRVRGELTELRAADLRFTNPEVDTFFNGSMQLGLTGPQVAALGDRTEGWVAALQLAALSMEGRTDIGAFIGGFTGDDRYIVDYLVEEVLQRQRHAVRQFLLHTAVLDRLTGPLCDAVTGGHDGRHTLEALERANMFLIALDNRRHWYRYHHLFTDVLRARLLDEQPDLVPTLHLSASQWYADNGQTDAAVHHALASGDNNRAADLIERAIHRSRRERTETTMLDWLQGLPLDVVAARPALGVALAGARLASGQVDGVAELLDQADRRLADTVTADGTDGVTGTNTDQLPGWVEVYRSGLAQANHDTAGTLLHARRAMDKLAPDDSIGGAAASALVGLASWAHGDLDVAHRAYAVSQAHFKAAGFVADVLGCAVVLAKIRKAQGRLQEALDSHLDALDYATSQPRPHGTPVDHPQPSPHEDEPPTHPTMRGVVDTYVGMADLYRERGSLAEAVRLLHLAEAAGDPAGLPQARYRRHVVLAQLQQALGNLSDADALLATAQRLYVDDFHPDVAPVAATRARLWVAQGRLSEAFTWARNRDLTLTDDIAYMREYEHLTLVRAHLADLEQRRRSRAGHSPSRDDRAELEAVLALLERLLATADANGRAGTVLDILIQQAVALRLTAPDGTPSPTEALQALERAFTLAQPEGYSRTFLDEGAPVRELLREAARQHLHPGYVRQLLHQQTDINSAATRLSGTNPAPGIRSPDRHTGNVTGAGAHADGPADVGAGADVVVEKLSQRELDVLRLLTTELNGPDIARQLVVSLNTVRTHTKSIYAKLGVTNRRAAVRRAHELHLLRPHSAT